nr:hypothetical protein [Kibdelosporangium sp. MJ126-NF4]CTQ91911.1 hypothetical protein [Kibdelosporangium sp. MJ126-NF4]
MHGDATLRSGGRHRIRVTARVRRLRPHARRSRRGEGAVHRSGG